MTVINLDTLATELAGTTPTASLVTFQYWAGESPYVNIVGSDVIFPKLIKVWLNNGETTPELDLMPTSVANCLKITIYSDGLKSERYVSIPATGPIDYGDLDDVDPETLEPSTTYLAAWTATLSQVETARDVTVAAAATAVSAAADLEQDASDAEAARIAAEQAAAEVVVEVAGSIDWSGNVTVLTADSKSAFLKRRLTGNVVVTVEDGEEDIAYSCALVLSQDGTGGRSIVFANVRTPYSVPIPLSTPANSVDKIILEWDGIIWSAYLGGTQLGIPASWVV